MTKNITKAMKESFEERFQIGGADEPEPSIREIFKLFFELHGVDGASATNLSGELVTSFIKDVERRVSAQGK